MPAAHRALPVVPVPPREPPPSQWALSLDSAEPEKDLVGVGADLEPGTLLQAYRRGLFPMGLGRRGARPIGWWSPDPRGILPLDQLHVSRSLRRAMGRFEIRVDTVFADVVAGCASPTREGRWITPSIARAYQGLHQLGWAHSVECWADGELAGGLYGLAIGGLFAGESMFSVRRDASKVALVATVELLRGQGEGELSAATTQRLFDVQWRTDHLATLGIVEVSRGEYLQRLETALELPLPPAFGGRGEGTARGRHAGPETRHPPG